jgi:ABC-type glycerol-3-phosphate transport system substrate-binding protein
MTKMTHLGVLLFAVAIGCAACDRRSPSGPTPLPPTAPSAPTVTAISPSTGSTARPTSVTINGTGFRAGATVTVDVVAVSVAVVNSTTITAIVPAHAAGRADVVVTNPGGSGGTLTAAFTYAFVEPFTITPSTNVIDAGGQMSVSWTAPGGRAGDWIAVVRVGGSYDDDWYGLTNGATSGTHTVTAPARPGQYEFRYLVDEGFLDVARSSPVTVR